MPDTGTRYRLSEVEPEYAAWMQERYPGWRVEQPFDVPGRANEKGGVDG